MGGESGKDVMIAAVVGAGNEFVLKRIHAISKAVSNFARAFSPEFFQFI